MKLSEKAKNTQMNKEAIYSIIIYVVFFFWWYFTGYGLSGGDPAQYTYIMGLPLWFFLSCIVGWLLLIVAVIFTVKALFKNFDLDSEDMVSKK